MTTSDRIVKFMDIMTKGLSMGNAKALADRLYAKGFFEVPASTKYHGSYPGGLFDHSYQVTEDLLRLTKSLGLKWGRRMSPYLVGMLHDLCKMDQYRATPDGYEYVPNLVLPGHGDKSVIVAQMLGIKLTEEEICCIRWHMGAFDDKANWGSYGAAIETYENVLWTHTADMMASRIQGV